MLEGFRTLRTRAKAENLSYSEQYRFIADLGKLKRLVHLRPDIAELADFVIDWAALMWDRQDLYPSIRQKLAVFLADVEFPLRSFIPAITQDDWNPSAVVFLSDSHLAFGTYSSYVKIFNFETGNEVRQLATSTTCMAVSPDKRFLATADGKFVLLWDWGTGHELQRFVGHQDDIFALAYSSDGRYLLTATTGGSSDRAARLWDISTGQELRQFLDRPGGTGIFSVGFSPDSQFVVIGQSHLATLYGINGQVVRHFEDTARFYGNYFVQDGIANFTGLAFSHDGRLLITANHLVAALWNAMTGQLIRAFASGHITDHAFFSKDDRFIFTVGSDGVSQWNWHTGDMLHSYHWPPDYVISSDVSFDGQQLITASNDGALRLWAIPPLK